jgi:cell division transport system permease protein
LQDIRYFIASAFRNLWESRVTSLFTAITLSVALGFLGAYLAAFLSLGAALRTAGEKFPLTVYLSDSVTAAQMDMLKDRLKSDPAVAGFDYTSKEQALKDFKGVSSDEASLIGGLGANPLPASFDVRLKAGPGTPPAERLVLDLRKMPGVEEVQYLQEAAGRLKSVFESFKLAGLILGVGVLLGVVFISYSTLRLHVLKHIEEIEVMKLMGSTRLFIMGPFLFEGAIQGTVAAAVSLGLLYGFLHAYSSSPAAVLIPSGITFLPAWAWSGMLAAGGLLGLTGSFFAFIRTLRM